jgi:NDP-sugar pyrophosphorylase family protein
VSFDALILAAGMGERLRPITSKTPKPLIPILGVPLIDYAMRQVLSAGPNRIFVNGYNLKEQIADYCLRQCKKTKTKVIFLSEDALQGSGGPVKRVFRDFGSEELLVHNADLIHDIHVSHVFPSIASSNSVGCLVMSPHNIDRDRPVYVLNHRVEGFGGKGIALAGMPGTFTGIYKVSKRLCKFMPELESFSIIDCFKSAMAEKFEVAAETISPRHAWFDLGTVQSFISAQETILSNDALIADIGWNELVKMQNSEIVLMIKPGEKYRLNRIETTGPALILSSEIDGHGKIGPNVVVSNSSFALDGEEISNAMIADRRSGLSFGSKSFSSGILMGDSTLHV